jgi:putative IMPACT (imprinted ancient) family translation regulator
VEAFRTLAGPVEAEIRERGSRFRAHAVPVSGRADAESWGHDLEQSYDDGTTVIST